MLRPEGRRLTSEIMADLAFDRSFDPAHGASVAVAPLVRRVTAQNGGPFTFHGTNSYIVGEGNVAVIDPGPDDDAHLDALMQATAGERISHIVVTHSHRDHSAGVGRLKARTGALAVAEGPHRAARAAAADELARLDASGDFDFLPDRRLRDGERIEGEGWSLRAIATPGHAVNHMAFALDGADLLFSGDHVMGWSTTVVAPPDGSMADYMISLDRLAAEPSRLYLPGHGGAVADGPKLARGLKWHRRMRESSIIDRVTRGDRTIREIVAVLYRDTPPALHGAAALSVFAHLEDLVERGRIKAPEGVRLSGVYEAAGD